MKLSNSLFMLCVGAVIGVVLVLSCGDNSPSTVHAADAGACNCPAAEPPLTGRIVEMDMPFTVPANSTQSMGVSCPFTSDTWIVLNGGCSANIGSTPNIILEQSYPGSNGWICSWSNPSNVDIPVHAIVHCLKAAQ